jgi:hypothetical protein
MQVFNTTAWCGTEFSFVAGDLVDVPDKMGADRIAAGLCRAATKKELAGLDLKTHPAQTATQREAALAADREAACVAKEASDAAAAKLAADAAAQPGAPPVAPVLTAAAVAP